MRALIAIILSTHLALAFAEPNIDLVRVEKNAHKLQLLANGKVVKEYNIALGGNPHGPKQQEGDGKTPEGAYTLDYKKADSSFHKAIHISYPSRRDTEYAKKVGVKPGGQVMIHGQKNGFGWLGFLTQHFDWTNGCVALSNKDMDEVWALVKAGTKIELIP